METKTYNIIEHHELNFLVIDRFPMSNFNVVADNELNNDTEKDFGYITKDRFKKWGFDETLLFYDLILGKKSTMWQTYLFLEFLVGTDTIPEGNYLVKVSW